MDAIALSRYLLDKTQDRSDLIALARNYIQKARQLLFERHRAGGGGMEIVAAYTTVMDYLIHFLFTTVSDDFIRRFPAQNQQCAVIAQGGYGRGELNPQSDIDLCFLYSWKVSPYVESVTEKLLYTLWDAGLQVGSAVRTVSESIRLAETDMKVKTTILDSRFLCGDYSLYGEFERSFEKRLIKKRAHQFIKEKLEESRLRHANYGGSVYLLEPEVKEGEGGLRDIHTARWIGRICLNARDFDALAVNGVITVDEVAALKESQDFLLRVRNELHFSTGKHHDQLTFEEQEKISHALGFEGEGTLKGVEVFMRSYYLHASRVSRLTSLVAQRLTDSARSFFNGRSVFAKTLREGVRLSKGELALTKPEIFRSNPGNLIRIFADAQKSRCDLSHEARSLVRAHLDLIDDTFRRSAAANLPFFEILKWKERVYESLSDMHRSGVLGALIPEFGRLLCMVLHDAYHIYTVDQHSLRLIKEIEELKGGAYQDSLPLLTQLAREADKIELLYLGLMFHDIGKGFGGGHSEIGANMIMPIARRMRLNVDDATLVEFLVRHHLLMTHTAFRRDLEDERTIRSFAETMGTSNNLKMLYLLTFADVKGVGPDIWNPWKASLLGELYIKALDVLEEMEKGGFERRDASAVLHRIQGRIRTELSRVYPVAKIDRFIATMPERYFFTTSEAEIVEHFALMDEFAGQGAEISVKHFPEKDCSSVVVCTTDRPGLFAAITGVFAALRLDILNARIFTSDDGRALDVFRISHHGKSETVMSEAKWSKFRSHLEGVLEGKTDVARLVAASGGSLLLQKRRPTVATVIQIDNEASEDFTIVEVFTADRIGVLFTITYALHHLGLSIHVAKISTNVDQVADVFYVADEFGGKISDTERLEEIKKVLYFNLAPQDERNAESLH